MLIGGGPGVRTVRSSFHLRGRRISRPIARRRQRAAQWRQLRFDDRGGVSIFVAVITGPLILLAGLLTVDAFGALRARQNADALAIEAARAAQQAVDLDTAIPRPRRARRPWRRHHRRPHLPGPGQRPGARSHHRRRTQDHGDRHRHLPRRVLPPHLPPQVSSTATLLYGTTQPEDGENP